MPVNGSCLGYGALVYSTTPIRGIVIAKTRAIDLSTASCARNVYCDNQGKYNTL